MGDNAWVREWHELEWDSSQITAIRGKFGYHSLFGAYKIIYRYDLIASIASVNKEARLLVKFDILLKLA